MESCRFQRCVSDVPKKGKQRNGRRAWCLSEKRVHSNIRKDIQAERALMIYGAWARRRMTFEEKKKAYIVVRESEHVGEL